MEAQKQFDNKYISSTELCAAMEVTRATLVNAYRRGQIPQPIRLISPKGGTQLMLWERDAIEPYMAAWRPQVAVRKARQA